MGSRGNDAPVALVVVRVVLCLVLLGAGLVGMRALSGLRKAPAEAAVREVRLRVAAVQARSGDVPVILRGFGVVVVRDRLALAPQVSGQVVRLHEDLEVGQSVAAGALVAAIDDRDYRVALAEARAATVLWQNTIARLQRQQELDGARVALLEADRELAGKELARQRELLAADVGTAAAVEAAERRHLTASNQAVALAQAVSLYPLHVREAESNLEAAEARVARAELDLSRCEIRAPFRGRVVAVSVEEGQYVARGTPLVTLADDTTLELELPLDSDDVRRWLGFREGEGGGWFPPVDPVRCIVMWVEAPDSHRRGGLLHRVVRYDAASRTVVVAVRLVADGKPEGPPLVDGMFCEVAIPGRTLRRAIRIPRSAVSFQGTVHVVVDQRLRTVPVTVARSDDHHSLITEGLSSGDLVVTTRLANPLEGTLLDVQLQEQE